MRGWSRRSARSQARPSSACLKRSAERTDQAWSTAETTKTRNVLRPRRSATSVSIRSTGARCGSPATWNRSLCSWVNWRTRAKADQRSPTTSRDSRDEGRNRLGLRFLRRFRLARPVEGDRLTNERLERGLVNLFSFVDVDRAACVSVETRVEETGRILQRRALEEGKLHDILVGFASADDGVVRPNRSAHPLPLLDDVRV